MKKANQVASSNANLATRMKNWLLLDNQLTHNTFCNCKCVLSLKQGPELLALVSNGGQLSTREQGSFGPERVWFHEKGVTNILSFSECKRRGYHLICDNDQDQFVMSGKGIRLVFKCQDGLHVHDLIAGVNLLSAVEENKKLFSKVQVTRADRAKQLHETIGFPSVRDFETIVQMNGIKNSPVVLEDIRAMKKIHGDYNVCALKGKTKRRTPKVVKKDLIDVPEELKDVHRSIELCVDVMHVQGLPFLVAVSKM